MCASCLSQSPALPQPDCFWDEASTHRMPYTPVHWKDKILPETKSSTKSLLSWGSPPMAAARAPAPRSCSHRLAGRGRQRRSCVLLNQMGMGKWQGDEMKISTKRAFQPAASKRKKKKKQVLLEAKVEENQSFSKGHTLAVTAWAKPWTCGRGKRLIAGPSKLIPEELLWLTTTR